MLILGSAMQVQAQGKVKVGGSIFGGGEAARVTGNDTVLINGSVRDTIVGSVFGGGEGSTANVVGNTYVSLSNGKVLTNVYGGGMEGPVGNDAKVTLTGGVVGSGTATNVTGGLVFGGGKGSESDATKGLVSGNTNVSVSGSAHVRGNVYGGGEMASVGSGNLNDKTTGVATVTISGGEVGPLAGSGTNAYVFGGGRGKGEDGYELFANVDSTSVIVCDSARIWGSIYGGSEDGHVLGDARVQLKKGNNTNNRIPVIGTNGKTSWDGNLYGGGRNFNYSTLTTGRVGGNIQIDMSDGELKGNLYGGGRFALTGMDADGDTIAGPNNGFVTINISGGTIGSVADTTTIGNVFGGGKGLYEVPGDEWGSIAVDALNWGRVKATQVNISGTSRIYGSVYGGGELAATLRGTNVRVSGGIIGSEVPREDDPTKTRYNGSVYGGGKGYEGMYAEYGVVRPGVVHGDASVCIEGGQVMENVYGGGEVGLVGNYQYGIWDDLVNVISHGKTTVTVTGGQIGPLDGTGFNGYVFGGGQGIGNDPNNSYKTAATVVETLVTVDIPANADTTLNRIWGSVYGGSADGHVWNDTKVEMKSGFVGTSGTSSYDGNIFGGGRNYLHTNFTAGRVGGNTRVEMANGTIFGDIYGGGRYGLTGVDENGSMQTGNHGNTKIIVKGGTIGNVNQIETFTTSSMGNIYGGGKGYLEDKNGTLSAESALLLGLTKNTEVEISDTINNNTHVYGIVLGGGEIANVGHYTLTKNGSGDITNIAVADGTGTTKVKISGGIIGGDKTQMRTNHWGPWLDYNDDLGYVYGGGEGWSDDPNKYEMVQDTSLLDLIATAQSTNVEISGSAWVKASVFGGAESGHVKKDTKVTISGGQIGAGYYEIAPGVIKDSLYVDSQFVRPDTVAITDGYALHGTAHWVYGADDGHGNTVYNPFDPELLNQNILPSDGKSWFGNVFGGGSGWFPYVEETSSEVHSHWYANSGKVWGNTEVIITGGHILNNVYGANESTDVGGKATVKMSGGTVGVPLTNAQIIERPLSGYIYGGGAGDPRSIFDNLTNVDTTDVQITGGIIYGSVIGGAEDGHILGNANVAVGQDAGKTTVIGSSGKSGYDGNIFGGGRNYFGENKEAGLVNGHTTINMSNGLAMGNVYGGGRLGSVLKSAHVNISGGKVGTEQIGVDQATIFNGSVYGGGLGFAGGKNDGNAHEFANVDSTYVNISGDAMIYNSVFGGGDNGHVLKSTVVTMTGGTVGQKITLKEYLTDNYEQYNSFIYTGNVLGGGKGIAAVYPGVYNDTTGIVFGNTNITIEGGTVRHGVYGGGGLSHVGTITGKDANGLPVFASGTGITKVIVKGDAHIGPTKEDLTDPTAADLTPAMTGYLTNITKEQYIDTVFKYLGGNSGMVFGAGCGLSGMVDLTFNDSTFVSITENAQVIGSVFGGGDNGHVARHTKVDVNGGTVGALPLHGTSFALSDLPSTNPYYASLTVNLNSADSEIAEDKFGFGRHVIRGEVYGGGKGTDKQANGEYSYTAGRVYGNTNVTISNGTIYNKVYGGGSLASVGTFTYHKDDIPSDIPLGEQIQRISYVANTGVTHVTINGGQIGTDGKNNGDVVGGGRGLVGNPNGYDTIRPGVDGADQEARMAYAGSTYVNIHSSADVRSSVYGGALNGHVFGDTHVTMDGGTVGYAYQDADTLKVHGGIHSNVYGGGGGTGRYKVGENLHLSISSGRVFGNTNVEINGGHVYHNVYGGGPIASIGTYDLRSGKNPEVSGTGTATVTITDGTIGLDSYEQNVLGFDGHDNGMVFGSGRGEIDSIGAYSDSLSFAIRTNVTIGNDDGSGPSIKGSVYGSGENGHVYLKSMVNVKGGTIGCLSAEYDKYAAAPGTYAKQLKYFGFRGNVYGGGCGTDMFDSDNDGKEDSYNPQSGIVWGDAEVNISGGYISRNVYGAGAMASVGYHTVTENHTGDTISWPATLDFILGGQTTVTVTGGHIGTVAAANNSGDVYGAARGEAGNRYKFSYFANTRRSTVKVDYTNPGTSITNDAACIVGSVYGSGENGHVYENAYDTINSGLIGGSVFGAGKGTDLYSDSLWIVNTSVPSGHVTDNDTMVHSVTAGKVYGNTYVVVNGGHILKNVYGGGNMASVGKGNYWGYGEGNVEGSACTPSNQDGITYVKINGGTIGTEVWGDSDDNGHVFGSSKGTSFPNNNKSPRYNYSRDFFLGYINYSEVTIGDGTHEPVVYGSVFGGGEDGHVRMNTEVVVNPKAEIGKAYSGDGTDITANKWKLRGNVYGAGRGIEKIAGTDNYCNSAGSVTRESHVIINGGLIHRDVYGGGSLAIVGPPQVSYYPTQDPTNTTVDILGGTIGDAAGIANMYGGNVYGSSRGEIAAPGHELDAMATVHVATVNIGKKEGSTLSGDALVNGSVYGSGENGHVTTNATVNIYSGRIGDASTVSTVKNVYCGNVYGAGSGTDMYDSNNDNKPDAHNPLAGVVKGNTTVNVEGGWVMRSVYGGGEIASVGTIASSEEHVSPHPFLYSWPYKFTYAPQTGKATVNVTGGRIGITGKDEKVDNGDIYGGSKGTVGDRYAMALLSNVDTAVININYADLNSVTPVNYKDTLAANRKGCITGAVYGGGENGHVNHNTYVTLTKGLVGHAIYGGGKGKDTYKDASDNDKYDITAGKVYGNTNVNINAVNNTDAYVVRSVFGGGNLASVGVGNYAGGVGDYNTTVGYGELVTAMDQWADTTNSGHTYITITGGTLGMLNPEKPQSAFKDTIPYGSVFGGCRGMAVPDVLPTQIDDLFGKRPDVFLGFVNHTHVQIGTPGSSAGPRLYGSVYGGAQDGHVRWNTNTVVNSGTIGVQFGTDVVSNNATINNDPNNANWTERGNVYGAGSGVGLVDEDDPTSYSALSGSVTQKTNVTINGGTIYNNVYGGGNLATVGPPRNGAHDCTSDLTGATVNINSPIGTNGSTYGGYVFGGSKGMPNPDANPVQQFKKFALVSYATVNINENADIANAVYGGSQNGQIGLDSDDVELIHNTQVNINGGAVRHSVYGAGEGVFGETGYTNDTIAGLIMGNSEVNLLAGTVNNVFGGGRNSVNIGGATVNVGKSDLSNTGVTITGNVYGANDHNGTPLGDVFVNVYKTAHTTANTYPQLPTGITEWTAALLQGNADTMQYAINAVFGGGNESSYMPGAHLRAANSTTVHVYTCDNTIKDLYGGANAADIGTVNVNADANLIVDGGRIHRVFGGGNGQVHVANIWGAANTTINAGLIDTVFGGGNQDGSILETNLQFTHDNPLGCDEFILDIFGGSNEAPIIGDVVTTLACGEGYYHEFYGGAHNANIYGNVTLNVEGGVVENLFGGSCGTLTNPANISKVTQALHDQYPVFPVGYGGNVTLNLYGGKHTNVFGGSDVNGNIEGVITVNVIDKETTNCELDITNLYGGSKQTAITSTTVDTVSPVVNVIHIAQEPGIRGNVFGGSLGDTATVVSNPRVNIGYEAASMAAFIPKDKDNNPLYIVPTNPHALVSGDVYGGGSLAIVHGNTEVNMLHDDAVVEGNIFGAGMGIDKDADTAKVIGNSSVNIATGWAKRSIFGGGNKASVDGDTYVVVSGGTIGKKLTLRQRYVDDRSLHDKVDDGDVYGGGEGASSNVGDYKKLGRVYGNTNVTVNGNAVVRHNVYGGGRMASVGTFTMNDAGTITNWTDGTGTATVTIGGNALIGPKKADLTENISAEELADAALVVGVSSLTVLEYIDAAFKYLGGNEGVIYGSGRGKPEPSFNWAAYVKETSVSIEDNAQVVGGVFGGGENGRVYQNTEVTIGSGTGTDEFVIGGLPLHGTSYPLSQVPTTNEYYDASLTIHLSEADSEIAEDEFGVGRRVMRGQVFGGGRGTDTYPNPYNSSAPALYNPIGGSVFGNTLTTIKGGMIYNNVYGGGTIASVGTFTYSPSVTDSIVGYAAGTGKTEIVINGGQIGTDGNNNGDVYGGGLGSTVPPGTQLTKLAYVGETDVKINAGANIKSNVYGGAASGHVQGDAHVTVNGGTIGIEGHGKRHSNVYGGGAGNNRYNVTGKPKRLSISAGRVFGDTYVTINNGTIYHNVYGGGAVASIGTYDLTPGHTPYAGYELGHGKATVNVKGGTIGYDGDENGMVFGSGRGSIDSIGAFVDSLSFAAYTEVNIGEVGTAGPTIKGSVYGAGENGHVYMQTIVNVNSGTIGCTASEYAAMSAEDKEKKFPFRGNVYGGGCGTDMFDTDGDHKGDTYNPLAGIVYGETQVNIRGGYISRNVYGGGAMSSVGYVGYDAATEHHIGDTLSWPVVLDISMGGKTEVNIYGGHIGTAALADVAMASGNVFGAARGDVGERYKMAKLANVKEAYVTVNFDTPDNNTFDNNTANVIIGSVFGGGESGHVYDTASVTVSGGLVVGSVFGAGDGSAKYEDVLLDPITDQPYSTMVRDIIAGKVFGNTSVTVNNGKILHNVYGGGNMASVGKGNYVLYGEDGPNGTNTDVTNTLNSGRSYVRIYGGTIGTDGTDNGHVYGSSRGIPHVSVRKDKRYLYNRDYFLGYVNQAYVTIGNNVVATPNGDSPRIYGSVFGSGQDGHVRLNTEVVVNDAEIGVQYSGDGSDIASDTWKYRGNVYGAGRGIDMYDSDNDGILDSYCSSAGSVTRNTHVVVNGGLIHRDVYGGGSLATVGPPPTNPLYLINDPSLTTVDILGGTIGDAAGVAYMYGGNVYGSSRGEALTALDNFATVKEARVNIGAKSSGGVLSGDAVINGSVYGSGENGHVNTNATVNIYGGAVGNTTNASAIINEYCGNVYGAGNGNDTIVGGQYNPKAGIVYGNTTINIEGGGVMRNVYGGGEMASVGTIKTTTKHEESGTNAHPFYLSWPYELVYDSITIYPAGTRILTGKATVNVTGGRIGITGKDGPTEETEKDNGDIYGGSKGMAFEPYTENLLSNVRETEININIANSTALPATYKDDWSLACIAGAVYGGGENGHVNDSTHITIENGLVGHAVYGAGKGKGKYTPNGESQAVYSLTAGKVYGDTHIDVKGGYVVRNVFGGGNLGSVGKGNYIGHGETCTSTADTTLALNSGRTFIHITGGTLGMLNAAKPDKVFKDDVPYGSVFGGCRGMVDATSDTENSIAIRLSHVNNSYVTIGANNSISYTEPHLYGSVFGGGQDGHVRWNTEVTVNGGEIGVPYVSVTNANNTVGVTDLESKHWVARGNVFGGGSGISQYETYQPSASDPEKNDTIYHFSQKAGIVRGTTTVEIKGGLVHRNVYGGGNLASVENKPTVIVSNKGKVGVDTDVNGIYVYGGDVFGAGRGFATDTLQNYCNVDSTSVTINGGYVYGDVYGGGENGHVLGNTNVYITGSAQIGVNATTTFDGNVFGGGWGSGHIDTTANEFRIYKDCGRVGGNTNVTMDGGTIQGTIFGGGRIALVGVKADGTPYLTTGNDYDSISDHGLATITVTGGTIGNSNPDELLNGSDESVGDIFGAGKGDVKNYQDVLAGRVANTSINISGDPTIYGSVFGGGEMAGIGYWDNTAKFYANSGASKVTIQGTPEIGTDMEFRYDYAQDDPSNPDDGPSYWTVYGADGKLIHTCTGNVYGGSQGDVDTLSPHWVSMARSRTAKVLIEGNPIIKSRVFGGAEQGSVAGNTWVKVNGGTIGSMANSDQPG